MTDPEHTARRLGITRTRLLDIVRANLRRGLIIAAVVGTALLLINHGDHIHLEPICPHFFAKAGLCYLVPFLVSLVSAVLAAGERGSAGVPPR